MDDRRVLIFPPSRRDGEVTRDLLERADLSCYVCYDAMILARELEHGAGTVLLTDAAPSAPNFDRVLAVLARQSPWSDVPLLVLCQAASQMPAGVARIIQSLTNVTLMDRPASARTLVSALQTAIRARLRQYETREQLRALSEAEEALIARERQLHVADRRKDEFLAMLAHELRNPLAPIRNASEFLARMIPDEARMQSSVGIVKRQVAHLSRLVDDLLDVSRITQGRIELQSQPVDLKTVVAQAMESVEPLMREKRHKLFLASSDGHVWVNGDSARLVQCVSNILTNAAKYTDRGGEIRIEMRKEPPEAAVIVTDNGVGIPPELLPQIFQLFVQSERSLDRSQGGLGIGLSVVQRLMEMHGGRVAAHSEGPGTGSTFEIRLPLIDVPAQTEAEVNLRRVATKRILIVDDNEDAANSMALLLNHEGHTAESVYSAAEALQRCLSPEAPDVILLDIGLPGMDGYEVARRLRARGCKAQLVALTGYGQLEDRERATAAGFDAHLVKPVDLPTLLHRLAS